MITGASGLVSLSTMETMIGLGSVSIGLMACI